MKIFIISLLISSIAPIMAYYQISYSWIPVILSFMPVILLAGLTYNIPVIGLWATKIESGRRLKVVVSDFEYPLDAVLSSPKYPGQCLLVMHYRKQDNMYKIWVKTYPYNSFWIKNK